MDKHPEFKVVKTNEQVTYAVTFPNTPEGISLMNEVRLSLLHRGYTVEANRMADIILEFGIQHGLKLKLLTPRRRTVSYKASPDDAGK